MGGVQDERFEVDVIGHDRMTNVAVLAEKMPTHFEWISLSTSGRLPEFGSLAFAITCPLDLDPSPVMGLFSESTNLWNHVFPTDCIRTSISANAGQGGCPVFDLNGQLIGMSVTLIPELMAHIVYQLALARVSRDLMATGRVQRGWMGLEANEFSALRASCVFVESSAGGPSGSGRVEEGDHFGHSVCCYQ